MILQSSEYRGALPEARIGGPDTTGPGNSKAADFLRHSSNIAHTRKITQPVVVSIDNFFDTP
jgi:hypothetical protein